MNKENILYGIIGLLVGVIVGFFVTNSINRSTPTTAPAAAASPAPGAAGVLPPDHPPPAATAAGGASASQPATGGGGPQADVTAAIQQARSEPKNFAAQMKAGSLYYQIGRYDQALEFYERARELKPDDFEALRELGNVTFDLKRWAEAEKWYQQALRLRPDDPNVRTDLGLTYYLREPRQLEQAVAAYRAALRADPRHEQALQNLTQALIDQSDRAGARETLRQLEQVNPSNQALAQFRAALGN